MGGWLFGEMGADERIGPGRSNKLLSRSEEKHVRRFHDEKLPIHTCGHINVPLLHVQPPHLMLHRPIRPHQPIPRVQPPRNRVKLQLHLLDLTLLIKLEVVKPLDGILGGSDAGELPVPDDVTAVSDGGEDGGDAAIGRGVGEGGDVGFF